MERAQLYTSPKGIANLHIYYGEQNLFSKKNRRAVNPPIRKIFDLYFV
jgi:hypothetical protein